MHSGLNCCQTHTENSSQAATASPDLRSLDHVLPARVNYATLLWPYSTLHIPSRGAEMWRLSGSRKNGDAPIGHGIAEALTQEY